MRTTNGRLSSQRGAVLIFVAIALLGLVAFSTFVVDYGIMWVSRGQVQTAADAGALSGAVALAFDNATDFPGAKAKARAVGISNPVFGAAPDIQLTDVTFPTCPPGTVGLPDTCVKVDAFRNLGRSNPLPVFFGSIVGLSSQGVRATATAQVVTGTTTDCLKPWAVIDRWDEFNLLGGEPDYPNADPDWDHNSTFDKYSTGRGNAPPPEPDLYVPPWQNGGTGFKLPQDYGRPFAIKSDSNTNSTVSPGWFRAIRIPRLDGQNGGNVYRENIATCGGLPGSYGDATTTCPDSIQNADQAYWAARGCFTTEPGNMVGPTAQGIADLLAKDPNAMWSNNTITNSAFSPGTASPRVVPIGVIDIDHFLAQDPSGANGVLKLVNIYGFFIEGMGTANANGTMTLNNGGKDVIGRLVTVPSMAAGTSTLPSSSAFLRQVILVR